MINFKIQQIVERDDGSREVSFRILTGTYKLVKNPITGKRELTFIRDSCVYQDTVAIGMNVEKSGYAVRFLQILKDWATANGYTLTDLLG